MMNKYEKHLEQLQEQIDCNCLNCKPADNSNVDTYYKTEPERTDELFDMRLDSMSKHEFWMYGYKHGNLREYMQDFLGTKLEPVIMEMLHPDNVQKKFDEINREIDEQ